MISTKELIDQLREVRKERGLSYDQVCALIQANGDFVSKSTLSRIFSEKTDKSEYQTFNYETTIRPIAKVLLDIETIEETDDMDVKAMKSLLKYKIARIEELEAELAQAEIKYHEKLDRERERNQKSIDFLTHQIELKDKRMDQLLEAVFKKDAQHKELLDTILSCPARKQTDCTTN